MGRLQIQAYTLQKKGNTPEENEDAWACDGGELITRVAVSDGASDAFESRYWSRALADRYIEQPPPADASVLLEWLRAPVETWRGRIHWDRLAWYAEEKARRGSFATLLGLDFEWGAEATTPEAAELPARWRAMVVGDVCLFQLREDTLVTWFPVQRSEEFGTTPALLSTRLDYSRRTVEELRTARGEARPGDILLIATDALAAWFLRQVESGEKPWNRLLGLSEDAFAALVEQLWQDNSLRIDDVTLLVMRVENETDHASDDALAVAERVQHGDPEPTEQL
ncbi:MAG TPA: protein phosphatase 2C domain-containing protein [Ardenticatenaceae bacterium]|nr:protein phosphatase 2C domain-containing protein [Ardenticatenaceae bacterium]